MKRILVPTDFSKQAENALKVAVQIAEKNNSEIYLIHSLEMPLHISTSGSSGGKPESLLFIKLAEQHFEDLFEKPYLQDLELHEVIGHGEVYNDINEVATSREIDLIVMGSHGISGFKEMFIGSNTEKVVRTANVPVLVIKNEHEDFDVSNFVFATDFSENSIESFKEAKKFADGLNVEMNLLYVNTPGNFITTEETKNKMKGFIESLNSDDFKLNIYNDTSVEVGILNFAKETNASLIGMSTHGRQGISHFFNGSISEDLVNHAKRPVITFKM